MSEFHLNFEKVLDAIQDGIVITDAGRYDGVPATPMSILWVNRAFERISGYSKCNVVGRSPRFLQGADTSRETRTIIRSALTRGEPVTASLVNYNFKGAPYWVELTIEPLRSDAGLVTHWIAQQRDLTARKRLQDELYRMATTDPLTGINNRRTFFERAAIEVDKARRYKRAMSAIMFDVDHFKSLNDEYGHGAGDRVLKELVARATLALRRVDILARYGGEEFVVALPETTADRAIAVAERLRHDIANATHGRDVPVRVTASFGVATLVGSEDTLDALLQRADAALYDAKLGGRNQVCVRLC